MVRNVNSKHLRYAVAVVLMLGTTATVADSRLVKSAAESSAPLSLAAATSLTTDASASIDPAQSYSPSQAGVRKAAREGPDALRRYVHRTRMIHNYYYWDFAKRQ